MFALSRYDLWALDPFWGFYYFREPIVPGTRRIFFPKRGWVENFIYQNGLLYILLNDRFGRKVKTIFDPQKKRFTSGSTGPLYRKVKYIFKSHVKVERCFIDGDFREGITAFSHPNGKLLWNSATYLRPAIKYTELLGDIVQAGEGIILTQNFFSRRGRVHAGYSIISFDYRTGEILWNIESYTYHQRLFPCHVEGNFMYITTGGHREGHFKKIDLLTGKILENEMFLDMRSGVVGNNGAFYFGSGSDVIAIRE